MTGHSRATNVTKVLQAHLNGTKEMLLAVLLTHAMRSTLPLDDYKVKHAMSEIKRPKTNTKKCKFTVPSSQSHDKNVQ